MSQSILDDCSVMHHQRDPMSDPNIDYSIEKCGKYQIPLGGAAGHLELGGTTTALYCDHLLVLPELFQNATQFWPCFITLTGLQYASAVQLVICLSKVQVHE